MGKASEAGEFSRIFVLQLTLHSVRMTFMGCIFCPHIFVVYIKTLKTFKKTFKNLKKLKT